jgi:hypothetical protein
VRLYLAAAVVIAASGAVIQHHKQRAAAAADAAPAPVMAAPERLHVVEVAHVASLPDAMSIERLTASKDEARDQAAGGWVLPDMTRKAPAVSHHRPPARRGPKVSAATSVSFSARRAYGVTAIGRIRGGLYKVMDRQVWRRSAMQNPFRDDSQYRTRRPSSR